MPLLPRKISLKQLGDMIREKVERNQMDRKVYEVITETGLLPIKYFRDKVGWLIERSDMEGYLDFTQL